jgi:3-oxoacyl-[acyl-carrier-protein] synthase III
MFGTNQPLKNVGIYATGKYMPERVMTNKDWEKILDTSDEWIQTKLGIRERRIAAPDEVPSDLGVKALLNAVERAGLTLDDIDCVISGSNTPDHISPQMAAMIMRKLGIKKPGFDVRAGGCSGAIFSLSVGARFVADGTYKTVAVVIPELNSRVVTHNDRTTSVILGDGAGCFILRPCKPGMGILHTELGCEPDGYFAAWVPAGGNALPLTKENIDQDLQYFHMDGKAVWQFGTKIIPQLGRNLSEKTGIALEDVDVFLTHQANLNIIKVGMQDMGVPFEKALVNVDRYGNMAGANAPVAMTEAVDDGVLKPGQLMFMMMFGAGLSFGAAAIRWCGPEDFEGCEV